MKYKILCLIFTIVTTVISAQNIKKGFKALEKKDYEKALESFQKDLREAENHPGANFGLAMLYADKAYAGHDIVKTWEYSQVTLENLNSLLAEDTEIINEYFFNTGIDKSTRSIQRKINNEIDGFEAMLIKYIREENNLDLVNMVIASFPDFHYYDNVVHIRNHLEFRKAEKLNTVEAYEAFMERFPDAAQIPKAIKNRNTLAYNVVKKQNTLEAYQEYLNTYPNADEAKKALFERNSLAFERAKAENTIDALVEFIYTYPDALEFGKAKNLIKKIIYEKAKDIRTLEAYNEFIRKYPSGEMYVDIFNLKSNDLGQSYLESYPEIAALTEWARIYDNKEKLDIAGSSVISNNEILIASNTAQDDSSDYSDIWLLSIDTKGELIWDKQFGNNLTDILYDLKKGNDGFYYGVGYTNAQNDTSNGNAWVFKIDNKGRKVWNMSIDALVASALVLNAKDQIIINGYRQIEDSVFSHYILKLNNEGKKLWERTYIDNYFGNDIDINANEDMLITTDNWIYMIDQQGYIKWESKFDTTYRAFKGAFNNNSNNSIVCGIKDSTQLFITMFDPNGQIIKNGVISNLNSNLRIDDMEIVDQTILITAPFSNGKELVKISDDLNSVKVYDLLPDAYHHNFTDITKGKDYIGISTSNDDIIFLYIPIERLKN